MRDTGTLWPDVARPGAPAATAVVIDARRLPQHRVNGWTAEPRERYYERLGVRGAERSNLPRATRHR